MVLFFSQDFTKRKLKFLEIISLATIGSERVVIGSLGKDNSNETRMTKKQ